MAQVTLELPADWRKGVKHRREYRVKVRAKPRLILTATLATRALYAR